MSDGTTYSAPGLKVVSLGSRGRGVVAERNFKQGEVIAIWRGSIITEREAIALPESERNQLLQVDEDAFLITNKALLTVDFINHSCEPNCGFTDSTTLVAMREIAAGETVTFDYAMSDTKPIFTFDCWCGSITCRKKIIGNDWQLRPARALRRLVRPARRPPNQAITALAGDLNFSRQTKNKFLRPEEANRPNINRSRLVAVKVSLSTVRKVLVPSSLRIKF